MAKEIVNSIRFKYDKYHYKTSGDLIVERMKNFFLLLPKFSVIFGIFYFISVIFLPKINILSEVLFIFFITFFIASIIFSYMVVFEISAVSALGVVNEARRIQFSPLNSERIKYYAYIGTTIYNFSGKDAKEALKYNLQPKNKKYDILLPKDIYTMGYNIPGSTGSGKTVTLNSTAFLPAIMSGNGFAYMEGKGDRPITEGIISFIYQYGRELDAYVLDFGAASTGGFTNGLSPLAVGDSKNVGELLKNLIDIMKGDNKWVSDMAIAFLEANLLPLVLLRDLKMVVHPRELKSIKTYKDLLQKEKFEFNLTILLNYLNFQAAIDLLYMLERLFKDRDFLKAMKDHSSYANLKDLNESILGRLRRNLTNHNINITALTEPDYSHLPADLKRNHPKATEDWINAIEIFASEKFYGNIFNKENSDFDALTAIQSGKIIITILPSMSASPEQNRKIGQMMTSIMKSAIGYMIEKGSLVGSVQQKRSEKRFRPRKLPYAYIFDEPSNYASEDIAQMSSMIRSVGSDGGGMAIFWTGQSKSDADRIDDDKKIIAQQLFANLGVTQVLNIQDDGWKKLMSEKCGKEKVFKIQRYEGKKDSNRPQEDLKEELELKYEENYFEDRLRPKTGESIIKVKGFKDDEKMVAKYIEPPVSDLFLNKNISYKFLMRDLKFQSELDNEIESMIKDIDKNIEEKANELANMYKSYETEVIEDLNEIISKSDYADLENIYSFTLSLKAENNPRAHGDYMPSNHHINIYNAINKPREHLVATAIHELTHHIEYLKYDNTGHSKRFYKILFEMFCVAIGLKKIDYGLAKEQKAIDSNDIAMMEKLFKRSPGKL